MVICSPGNEPFSRPDRGEHCNVDSMRVLQSFIHLPSRLNLPARGWPKRSKPGNRIIYYFTALTIKTATQYTNHLGRLTCPTLLALTQHDVVPLLQLICPVTLGES
eukprot:scaffold1803_cov92-Amphora_coffeaeformis.AAC.50